MIWREKCTAALDSSLLQYIDTLDFSIFHAKQPLRMIDEHAMNLNSVQVTILRLLGHGCENYYGMN